MKYVKIYEEFSATKEKYMIVDKDETIVLNYINNFNKRGDIMRGLFIDINTIDPKITPFILRKYICEDVLDGFYTGTPFYFPETELTSGYNFIDLMGEGITKEDITQNIL